jgi:hypothetical protein
MDLRDEFIGLACDNRASAKPFPGFGIFPSFPESGKGERASVFHGKRERQLCFSRFAPFVESGSHYQWNVIPSSGLGS